MFTYMEQDIQAQINYPQIAIIGGGPSGVMAAIFAAQKNYNITIFEKGDLLKTLLQTGNGRCNITYNEPEFKELTKFYPRGNKFLYSVFARFNVLDTINFFENLGIKLYTQNDNRMFPISNNAQDVRQALLKKIAETTRIKVIKKRISHVSLYEDCSFNVNHEYIFDKVIVAIGGKSNLKTILKGLKLNIVQPKPALCALKVKEDFLYKIPGVCLKNVNLKYKDLNINDDIMFSHQAITGPLIYKLSSYMAYEQMPYCVKLNFANMDKKEFINDLNIKIKESPNKLLINTLSYYFPKSFVNTILSEYNLPFNIKNIDANKALKEKIASLFCEYELNIIDTVKQGEVVTAGGVDLDQINPKTLECKTIKGLYFIGEALDVDGLCGGFNLQNCWSTGFVSAMYL